MHALNILSLNVNGLDSAVERACVLEYVCFSFSLPLSLPLDWTFKVLSMCLLFCFVCFEWMLCCDVVC